MSTTDEKQQPPTPEGGPDGKPTGAFNYTPQQPAVAAPAPKPKMSKGKKWGIGLGALIAVGIIGNIGDPQEPATAPAAAIASPSPSTTAGTFPTVDPSVQASLDKAAADKSVADAKAAAAAEAKKKAQEAAAEKARLAAAAKAAAALRNPASYAKISGRNFAKVAKNPDNYIGKKYVIHGYVTQFDSATGTETFRANLVGPKRGDWYDYEVNSIVDEGIPGIFDDVVQDDMVTIYVEVQGSFSYDTQIGGNTTVPRFTANIVKVTGSTN